ncbi:MAG: hypothetical protein AB8H79_14865 [Myxococcota bacterium]
MRVASLLLLLSCGTPADPGPDDPAGPCVELIDPISGTERTQLGITANGVRVLAGRPHEARLATGAELDVEPSWVGGLSAFILASAQEEAPVDAPPLWCEDRVQVPALLELASGDQSLSVAGEVRAAGLLGGLTVVFIGEVQASDVPPDWAEDLDPALPVWVWAWLDEDDRRGEFRQPLAGGAAAGPVLGSWSGAE